MKKIVIIQGHPDPRQEHFCDALANSYQLGADTIGHSCEIIKVSQLNFPMLRSKSDHEHGEIPSEIKIVQQKIAVADHLVFVYPLWFGEMPSLLKAFLEQVMRPGFAYNLTDSGSGTKKLAGKSARIIITMGMPAVFYCLPLIGYGAHSLKAFEKGILNFVGIKPVRATMIGMIESKSTNHKGWLEKMKLLGKMAV